MIGLNSGLFYNGTSVMCKEFAAGLSLVVLALLINPPLRPAWTVQGMLVAFAFVVDLYFFQATAVPLLGN